MTTQIDHLVVVAHNLAQGVAWCESTLGVVPGPGGTHPLMGTHNRLLNISSPSYPQAYLEILAIDPEADPPDRPRWFGLDEPRLQAAVQQQPRLVHVVMRTRQLEMLRFGLVQQGQDPGQTLAASRRTDQGLLQWQILVRDDGQIACAGALPTLIEWQGQHPADALPPSAVQLRSVAIGGLPPRIAALMACKGVLMKRDGPALRLELQTRRGSLTLSSDGAASDTPPRAPTAHDRRTVPR